MRKVLIGIFLALFFASTTIAADNSSSTGKADLEKISKELANPVSSIKNLPLRYDYDADIGKTDGERHTLRIQPIISFPISSEWSVLSRTVIPIINQTNVMPVSTTISSPSGTYTRDSWTQSGIGDIQESVFFTTKASGGIMYGFGPIVSIPSSDDVFSSERLGMGPTGIFLFETPKWTFGLLANHVWSVAGGGVSGDKGYTSMTTAQPFISYNLSAGWSVSFNAESTYDWKSEVLLVPLDLQLGKVLRLFEQTISISVGGKYVLPTDEDVNPEWGARAILTYIIP